MYSPMSKVGFWSETEEDSARLIKRLPEIIIASHPVIEQGKSLNNVEREAKNIYEELIPALKLLSEQLNSESLAPINSFHYAKVSELTVAPKNNPTAGPLHLTMYHVNSEDLAKMNYYFLIDENKEVAAYAHYSILKNSPNLEPAYDNLSMIAVDAIESKRKGSYSLGTVLMQAIFEHSLLSEYQGRITLYSANKSGGFYFKLGFTALNETTFDALFYEGKEDVDGGVMFLTNAAINAWKERASLHPLLENSPQIDLTHN